MKLYGYFRSSAAFRVRIALNLKDIAVEHVPVHLLKDGGQQKFPKHRELNPQALVPVLELDDGTVLCQSLAIIEYLDASFPGARLIPNDPLIAAKARAVALIIGCEIHPLNNLRVLNYLKGQLGQSKEAVDVWIRYWMLNGGLDAIEKLLPGDDFCFGSTPSLADCFLWPQLLNAKRFNVDYEHLRKIKRVEHSCEMIDAFSKAHPSRQPDAE
ncbi:MAG: maleylacetoacetate isomerase [Alphaproteobacteria bacterium]